MQDLNLTVITLSIFEPKSHFEAKSIGRLGSDWKLASTTKNSIMFSKHEVCGLLSQQDGTDRL
jgi:hypothetical protein